MSNHRVLHFRDSRPPQEIQFALERDLMVLLQPVQENSRLVFHGSVKIDGGMHSVRLRFEAALPRENCYSLTVTASGAEPARREGHLQAASGWFEFWTRDFQSAPPPPAGEGAGECYRALVEQAIAAEAHLTSVPAVQEEILAAMRRGAMFSTAHKEGGTRIAFEQGRFVRTDYGEWDRRDEFPDDAAFRAFLRKFFDWDTSRNTFPEKVSDFEAWKLILRLLEQRSGLLGGIASSSGTVPRKAHPGFPVWKPVLVILLLVSAAFSALWPARKALMVQTTGHPIGLSMRAGGFIATLVYKQEPYMASLHRDPAENRFTISLLLHSTGSDAARRLIPIARNLPPARSGTESRLLGVDGNVLWLYARGLAGYDLVSGKVITLADFRRANPALESLWDSAEYRFDQHVRITSGDASRTYVLDPITLVAKQDNRPRKPLLPFSPLTQPTADSYLCAGGQLSPTEWLGAPTAAELAADFKPNARVVGDYPAKRSVMPRRLYRGRIAATQTGPRFNSMTPLTDDTYLNAAFVRASQSGAPLRLSGPDGFLLTYSTQPGPKGTLVAARLNAQGQVVWKTDTGIAQLQQILPDAQTTAFIGTPVSALGKTAKPVLVIINLLSGTAATHPLAWTD